MTASLCLLLAMVGGLPDPKSGDGAASAAGNPAPGGVLTQPPSGRVRGLGLFSRHRAGTTAVPPPRPASSAPNRPASPASDRPKSDAPVRRTQDAPADIPAPLPPAANAPADLAAAGVPGGSLSMEAALYGALTRNPDLIALRQGDAASAEALEVARHFPTTLNPTLWVDIRPLVYERVPAQQTSRGRIGNFMDQKDALMYFSLRQPIELGGQQSARFNIAKAAYNQQQWTTMQAELTALVQTYRLFQTAAYRREKLRMAEQLAEFNDRLVGTLTRRLEAANQVQPADVALAEVEAEATRQAVEAARQDYATALSDLRNQLGIPDESPLEPLGEFVLPGAIPTIEDAEFVQLAIHNRPDLHAARAAVQGAKAAVCLAKGDKVPTPIVGPVYERDEQGTQFFGFVYITPIPVINTGQPLVRQREAEYRRAVATAQGLEQRAAAQVRAAIQRWNGAVKLLQRTSGSPAAVRAQIAKLEQLFELQQADLSRLLQARRSLIQIENSRLDALWQATQAQADLLAAVGAPSMINALQALPRTDAPGAVR